MMPYEVFWKIPDRGMLLIQDPTKLLEIALSDPKMKEFLVSFGS